MPAAALRQDARHLTDTATFRAVMDAMARPGLVKPLTAVPPDAPAPLNAGAAALALCLIDFETPVWLDEAARAGAAPSWLRFETGARIVDDPKAAAFAFVSDARQSPDFMSFALGSADYPDRSATLILQVERFEGDDARRLAGPGIVGTRLFSASSLPDDLIFVSSSAVAALPRSTRIVPRSG
jgi:alpha-D-ribose 1-methylphosphonate 5-triphosphate synthase subunit PhnH